MKPGQLRRLEHLYRRRLPPERVISQELARNLTELSHEIKRQLGLLVSRHGTVESVMVGDARSLEIPPLERVRQGLGRLQGLRCLHTHLGPEPLNKDDLNDLAILRLDMMVAIEVQPDGLPGSVHCAHLLPTNADGKQWEILPPRPPSQLDMNFLRLVHSLEEEFARVQGVRELGDTRDRAILMSVVMRDRLSAEESLHELAELARAANIVVLDAAVQLRQQIDAKYLLGRGKLRELVIKSLQLGAELIVFDQELTPTQARSISEATDLKVIDRTQLILDIFAKRASSRDGKIQVELAQLKYLLPRLRTKESGLSRLTGGIGARGPGETTFEIQRRRVRERIHRLEAQIEALRGGRRQKRALRERKDMPVISIVGYTNAGKTTLLNSLTNSQAFAADQPFATLDPMSRRLRFPEDREVIVTDTVGFIRHLPKELIAAFRATLEELRSADLLLHVVDVSHAHYEEQMATVEGLLKELGFDQTPVLIVFNKQDKVAPTLTQNLCRLYDAVAIEARNPASLPPLIERIQAMLWGQFPTPKRYPVDAGEPVAVAAFEGVD
ncbi:MAG TPA: GTPase HflX [Alphaproteobacteria bacterium]|nr:GTPase HflX [Alphaproteobacteria bacterium]